MPRPVVALVFSKVGLFEEELVEAPEAVEMPMVLWQVARCTGAEDFVGTAEDFGGSAEDFEGAA